MERLLARFSVLVFLLFCTILLLLTSVTDAATAGATARGTEARPSTLKTTTKGSTNQFFVVNTNSSNNKNKKKSYNLKKNRHLAVHNNDGDGNGIGMNGVGPRPPSTQGKAFKKPTNSPTGAKNPTKTPTIAPVKTPTKSPTTTTTTTTNSPTLTPVITTPIPTVTTDTNTDAKTSSPTIVGTIIDTEAFEYRELLPFDLIFEASSDDELVKNTDTVKFIVEEFLYDKLADIYDNLRQVSLQEESSSSSSSSSGGQRRRRKLLEQIFSYTGQAEFVDVQSLQIPTNEELQIQQLNVLSTYLYELQDLLRENGIMLTLKEINTDGNNGTAADDTSVVGVVGSGGSGVGGGDSTNGGEGEGEGGSTNDDDDSSATAIWLPLLGTVALFSIGCYVFRRSRSQLLLDDDHHHEGVVPTKHLIDEYEQQEDGEKKNKHRRDGVDDCDSDTTTSSYGPNTTTWANIIQQQNDMFNTSDGQDYLSPEMKYMNVPKLEQNQVVHLRDPTTTTTGSSLLGPTAVDQQPSFDDDLYYDC